MGCQEIQILDLIFAFNLCGGPGGGPLPAWGHQLPMEETVVLILAFSAGLHGCVGGIWACLLSCGN